MPSEKIWILLQLLVNICYETSLSDGETLN